MPNATRKKKRKAMLPDVGLDSGGRGWINPTHDFMLAGAGQNSEPTHALTHEAGR